MQEKHREKKCSRHTYVTNKYAPRVIFKNIIFMQICVMNSFASKITEWAFTDRGKLLLFQFCGRKESTADKQEYNHYYLINVT